MGTITSEMAGTLVEYSVKEGESVKVGDAVAVVESMKMEVPLVSKVAGKVSRLLKSPGDFVNEGETLVELT